MQELMPARESTRVDLSNPSPTKDVALQIDVLDEDEYKSGSGSDEEDESPPLIKSMLSHKVTTRSSKSTLAKTAIKAPTSQGGSSTKKARKGK